MPDVRIRNLRVRIVRKGTLFWGDDPRRLARRTLAALPQILAEQLEAIGVEDVSGELTAPVRLSLRGSLASLLEALASPEGTPELRALVGQALRQALDSGGLQRPPHVPSPKPPAPTLPAAPGAAPLGELLQLHLRGELAAALERFPLELLEAYHRRLLEQPPPDGAPARTLSAGEAQEMEHLLQALATGPGPAHDRPWRLRQRLLAVVNLAASTGASPFEAQVRASVEQWLPLEPLRDSASEDVHPGDSGPAGASGEGHPGTGAETALAGSSGPSGRAGGMSGRARGEPAPRRESSGPVTSPKGAPGVEPPDSGSHVPPLPSWPVASGPEARPMGTSPRRSTSTMPMGEEWPVPILPLLGAGLLTRAGLVARVQLHLAAAGCAEELPLWIAALTFKLGPPPFRGWRHAPEVWTHAALISGTQLFSGEWLTRLADAPSPRWPELTTSLVQTLAPADATLVAAPHGKGVALVATAPLGPVWAGAADTATLQGLAAGRPLLRHPRLAAGLLPGAEPCPSELADPIRETLAELEQRPACTLAQQPHFDHHIGVLAGWALARMGATLWPGESPPVPLMLERFASLEVYVRRDGEGLSIRVPLGKRHADLYRAGLLRDLHPVPWMSGGSLRFRGA